MLCSYRICVKLSEVFDTMKVSYAHFLCRIVSQCTTAFGIIACVSVRGQMSMTSVAENNLSTLGLGLDMDSRYQEAEKVRHLTRELAARNQAFISSYVHLSLFSSLQEMLFRRTCKLVELEAVSRNAEKAKPVKKAAVSPRAHTQHRNTQIQQMHLLRTSRWRCYSAELNQ